MASGIIIRVHPSFAKMVEDIHRQMKMQATKMNRTICIKKVDVTKFIRDDFLKNNNKGGFIF